MENLLEIAKKILEINENACLTGTLMLKLRGIDLGREPHDIDILISDYAPNIKIPEGMKLEECGHSSDGSHAKYKYKGVEIDILSDGEEPEIVNGLKLGTVEKLIEKKYLYSIQNNSSAEKHHKDLIKLGYKFPEKSEDDDIFELPF